MIFHCRYIQYFVYSFFYSLMLHPVWCDISSLWHLGDVGHISKLAINPTGSLSHFLILLCPHPAACLACSLILATASAVASSASFHGQRILLQGLVSAPQGSPIPFMMQNVAGSGFSPSYYFPCMLYFVLCLVPDDVLFPPPFIYFWMLCVWNSRNASKCGHTLSWEDLSWEEVLDKVVRCHKPARLRQDETEWKEMASYLLLTQAVEDSALSKGTLQTQDYSRRHQYQRDFSIHPWIIAGEALATKVFSIWLEVTINLTPNDNGLGIRGATLRSHLRILY